jgi:hypothetical protein
MLGVARTPLRLMTDAKKGSGAKAKDVARPRSISRREFGHLKRNGYLTRSTASHEDVQEITDHPLLDMLDHPDSEGYFSREDIIGLMSAYCDVVGVAYCKLDPVGGDVPPTYCWPMQAQYVVDIKLPSDPRIDHYTYFNRYYSPQEILRFRSPSLGLRDPYGRGYSPTFAALQYAMLEDKYVAVQDELLAGPVPKLLISPKDATMPFGEPERKRYEQDVERLHARGKGGRVIATNGAVDINPISYPPTDLGGMELSKYDLERTCNVFGIPIAYFSTETNLANLQAAESQHARTAIEPRCKSIAGTLTRLAQRFDERLFFAFDCAIEEDKEREAKIVDMGIKSGRITINEANTDSPWEPKEWGDQPWLPGTLQQPTMLTEAHEQGIETAKAGVDKTRNETDKHDMSASDFADRKSADSAKNQDRSAMATGQVNDRDGLISGGRGIPADGVASSSVVVSEAVESRFDSILAAMERSLGL